MGGNLHLGLGGKREVVALGNVREAPLHDARELLGVVFGDLEAAPVAPEVDLAALGGLGLVGESGEDAPQRLDLPAHDAVRRTL